MAMPQRDDPPSLLRASACALCASAIAKAFADKMADKTEDKYEIGGEGVAWRKLSIKLEVTNCDLKFV